MKDVILITAYCPDPKREKILRDLVVSLSQYKEKFDVILISHTEIPVDISRNTFISIYDSKNEILTDWDLLNQPWFSPSGNGTIYSSFLTRKNTLLAVWRMMIMGFGLIKGLGYKKVHHLEYDCKIENVDEIIENSTLLEKYDSVFYMDRKENVSEILFGSFQSYYIPHLSPILLELDEEKIKDLIRKSPVKSPEPLLQNLLTEGKTYFVKDRSILERKGNIFGIVDGQIGKKSIPWAVPYFDPEGEVVRFIIWNNIGEDVDHKLIINGSTLKDLGKTPAGYWSISEICPMKDFKSLMVIENDFIRDNFNLEEIGGEEIFKKMSYKRL